MSSQLPEDVHRFISEHINSVEQLEVLLLLREHADRQWSPQEVSQALYTPPAAAEMRLEDLHSRGFLAVDSEAEKRYCYHLTNGAVDPLVSSLAELYEQRRVTVISLIYSKPHSQVQAFADAFKFRKDT